MRLRHIWLSSRDKWSSLKATDYFKGRDHGPVLRFYKVPHNFVDLKLCLYPKNNSKTLPIEEISGKNISLFVSIPYDFIYGVFPPRMLLLHSAIASVLPWRRPPGQVCEAIPCFEEIDSSGRMLAMTIEEDS
jgi:hypothetical protein